MKGLPEKERHNKEEVKSDRVRNRLSKRSDKINDGIKANSF